MLNVIPTLNVECLPMVVYLLVNYQNGTYGYDGYDSTYTYIYFVCIGTCERSVV